MDDIMIIEDGKLKFYSFILNGADDLNFDIIGDKNLVNLYNYYITVLNNEGLYDTQILIENYIKSLRFYVDYSLSFENSLNEYYNNEAPEHITDIINEGINNKEIFDYFTNNGLLKSDSNVKVKK